MELHLHQNVCIQFTSGWMQALFNLFLRMLPKVDRAYVTEAEYTRTSHINICKTLTWQCRHSQPIMSNFFYSYSKWSASFQNNKQFFGFQTLVLGRSRPPRTLDYFAPAASCAVAAICVSSFSRLVLLI